MNNRVTTLFNTKKKNILSIFFTAGFPSLHDTVTIAQQLQEAGVDCIEIGIPFSDPIADGPTIQASNKQALENGMTVRLLLQQVKEIRKTVSLPIILMGYLNPVYQYGIERFIKDAKEAGVDGLILPDMPLADYKNVYQPLMQESNLSMAFLVTPTTTDERIRKIDDLSSGFMYAVSASSTTGSKQGFSEDQVGYFRRLKSLSLRNPMVIGFGISNAATFSTACKFASGAIIGSAFINTLEKVKDDLSGIQQFVKEIKV